jgi:hypothetical protein
MCNKSDREIVYFYRLSMEFGKSRNSNNEINKSWKCGSFIGCILDYK